MGQKVNPIGFRTGVYLDWKAKWFARGEYGEQLLEDLSIRNFIDKRLKHAEIANVVIEKAGDAVRIVLFSGRPGIVIGKKGQEIDALRQEFAKLLNRQNVEVSVQEVKRPELDATLVARSIADQLTRRASYKKVMKRTASTTMRSGAKGIYIRCAGRIGGAEIARAEWVRMGSVPRHTLRADIDYSLAESMTTYGIIGVQVWICRGEYKDA
ncbi:30S ribosomal protein S3 [bacterium]|nr:30S ribosomal protein S3 [bacterium]MBT4577947.1 30S ribosomal protein S3 [bacterium]MBT5346109.1 30S ribosomal protein S3 [bacterium]MBT6131378.1 30S ribosomal protein S3 [bacterium]MBT6529162.1 30S ribosomal protein S3 [bacterium]